MKDKSNSRRNMKMRMKSSRIRKENRMKMMRRRKSPEGKGGGLRRVRGFRVLIGGGPIMESSQIAFRNFEGK